MYTAARRLNKIPQQGKQVLAYKTMRNVSVSSAKLRQNDPLYYGTTEEKAENIPTFRNGKKIYDELESLMDDSKPLQSVLNASPETMKFFNKHFPQVVDSNSIGEVTEQDFNSWKPNKNNIAIELDREPHRAMGDAKDVYIGGPAALFAAALQAHDTKDSTNVLYGHDGARGASNWKGSASYYHIRDCIPVYYWPDNSGVYTVYCTLKHYIQKKFFNTQYKKEIYEDPNFNKLRLNLVNLLKEPLISWLMIKNTWNTIKDVNLHLTKTHLRKGENSTAYVSMEHARLTRDIVPKMELDKPMLMLNNDDAKALHLHLGDGAEESRNVFRNLTRIIGDAVKNIRYTDDQLRERGYDPKFVEQGLEFPNDGYIPPYTDQVLEKKVTDMGGDVNGSMRLKKVLVTPTNGDDYKASKIVWEDTRDGTVHVTPVRTLHLSLGPSSKMLSVEDNYGLGKHLSDVFTSKVGLSTPNETSHHQPTVSSWLSRVADRATGGNNMLNKMMWASGLTSCCLIKVDKSIVPESAMTKFRDHVDAHNKHAVRLAEKEINVDGKSYQLFALQFTGGGHFPAKNVHAEAALNVLKANFVPLLGLDDHGVEYEIIQARSCARGITAQNCFRFKAPLANMVQLYGVGGIGMTTMAPNALLMKALLGARQKLSAGEITPSEFVSDLKNSTFSEIPHWPHPNPFTRNYAQFVDSVSNPKEVAAKLGVPTESTVTEPTFDRSQVNHLLAPAQQN